MSGLEWLAVTAAAGKQLHDPGTASPVRLDVLRSLYRFAEACGYGPYLPGDLTAVTDLVMRCGERNLMLPPRTGG